MLGKRSRLPTIGKLAEAIRSSGIVDSITSPRSPLDCTMRSPRGLKNYDQQGGVGLGIVVALDNNTNKSGGEILAKYALNTRFPFSSRPIPMNKSSGTGNNNELEAHDNMLDEEFTYVTSYGPKKSTKVYCNGVEYGHVMGRSINQNYGVFKISSPARLFDDRCINSSDNDFLSSCHLCRKTLHGKDIYMYRGEKAFCSTECREKQISIDERKEKCGSSEAYVSSSPCSYTLRKGQMFSNGIMAA